VPLDRCEPALAPKFVSHRAVAHLHCAVCNPMILFFFEASQGPQPLDCHHTRKTVPQTELGW